MAESMVKASEPKKLIYTCVVLLKVYQSSWNCKLKKHGWHAVDIWQMYNSTELNSAAPNCSWGATAPTASSLLLGPWLICYVACYPATSLHVASATAEHSSGKCWIPTSPAHKPSELWGASPIRVTSRLLLDLSARMPSWRTAVWWMENVCLSIGWALWTVGPLCKYRGSGPPGPMVDASVC